MTATATAEAQRRREPATAGQANGKQQRTPENHNGESCRALRGRVDGAIIRPPSENRGMRCVHMFKGGSFSAEAGSR